MGEIKDNTFRVGDIAFSQEIVGFDIEIDMLVNMLLDKRMLELEGIDFVLVFRF